MKLAVESSDWIQCDEWEVKQKGWTRTKIVMDRFTMELNKKFGEIWISLMSMLCQSAESLLVSSEGKKVCVMFLCGADILGSMSTPGDFLVQMIRNKFSVSDLPCAGIFIPEDIKVNLSDSYATLNMNESLATATCCADCTLLF